MAVFVDAIEYAGDDVPPVVGAARVPIRHHAFDTDTGRLAHGPARVRVGFPAPSRSWAAVPRRARRCTACSASVTQVVAERIHRQLSALVDEQFPTEKEKP